MKHANVALQVGGHGGQGGIACDRIDRELDRLPLLEPPPPAARQRNLIEEARLPGD